MKKLFWYLSLGVFVLIAFVHFLPLTKRPHPNIAIAALSKLPLFFIENRGQLNSRIKFYLQAQNQSMIFKDDEIIYSGGIKQKFIAVNPETRILGLKRGKGKANYLVGKDPAKWKREIPTYQEIVYRDLYPGIDLVFSSSERKLKSEFRVAAGADYKKILVAYEGLDDLRLSDTGDLVIQSKRGEWKETKPWIYQIRDGKQIEIEGNFVLYNDQYGFEIFGYDPKLPLVIDPEVIYSTYLGGSYHEEGFNKIAVDASGHAYVIGTTNSQDFPTTPGSFQPEDIEENYISPDSINPDIKDWYLTKLSPNGQTLVYSTYLGGDKADHVSDIAIDSSGHAYIVGQTLSADFPTVGTPIHTCGDVEHPASAIITKLSPDGASLVYSTCLRASWANGVAVDSSGSAYVTGFDTWGILQTTQNAYQASSGGNSDAFIMKLSPDGANLIYSTYLGGSSGDFGKAIAIDASGNAYVTGETRSTDFPIQNALQATTADDPTAKLYEKKEVFITKLSPDGSSLVYSTYLGGVVQDWGESIAVDANGNAYVVGSTKSTNFPITQNALKATLTGSEDAFITKLSSDGQILVYSTYLGGDDYEEGRDIAIGADGGMYIVGVTTSTNFPIQNALQIERGGWGDAFITKLDGVDLSLVYSTYFGGSYDERAEGIAVDASRNVYVTGTTQSNNFPTQNPFQPEAAAGQNAFVLKIYEPTLQPDLVIQSAQRDSPTANALTARYHVVIANQGTAASARPFLIRINSIRWGVRGPKIFKKKNVLVLLPGESLGAGATLEKNYWIPQADKTEFIVDIGKNITESNEDNNSLTVPWQ